MIDLFNNTYKEKSGKELPKVHIAKSKPGTSLNEGRLRASILLFKWIYGEDGFASNRYLTEERDYKKLAYSRTGALRSDWQASRRESPCTLCGADNRAALGCELPGGGRRRGGV